MPFYDKEVDVSMDMPLEAMSSLSDGRTEQGMLMGSTRARSAVLEDTGYEFRYPAMADAADAVSVRGLGCRILT